MSLKSHPVILSGAVKLGLWGWAMSLATQAQALSMSDCLAMARGYYQQSYCEIKAQGEGHQLPAFYQFKQNNEQTQWLLLKRPAERAGIKLRKPQAHTSRRSLALTTPKTSASDTPTAPLSPGLADGTPSVARASAVSPARPSIASAPCQLQASHIICGNKRYELQRNRHNRHLDAMALSVENTLTLPRFSGNINDETAVRNYLYSAYSQYLTKMRSIGLGGITTTFGNFSYLFYDYHAKGLDFSERFAKLFHYLKKDKASLPISERAADVSQLTLADCAALNDNYFVCEHRGKNILFAH